MPEIFVIILFHLWIILIQIDFFLSSWGRAIARNPGFTLFANLCHPGAERQRGTRDSHSSLTFVILGPSVSEEPGIQGLARLFKVIKQIAPSWITFFNQFNFPLSLVSF